MTLVNQQFPDLNVNAINYEGKLLTINILNEAIENRTKVLLFWYPKDFTFVCPTELHAFQEAIEQFKERNTLVIGASCDTSEVHFAWLNTKKEEGGIMGITYPLLADSNRNLASRLGILDSTVEEFDVKCNIFKLKGDNVTYRATYLIDEEGKVFHESINHMPLGRNVNEYLRLIDAYTHVQKNGEVCPANWKDGETALTADRNGVAEYLSKN